MIFIGKPGLALIERGTGKQIGIFDKDGKMDVKDIVHIARMQKAGYKQETEEPENEPKIEKPVVAKTENPVATKAEKAAQKKPAAKKTGKK
jgi:hypothetical protein